MWKEEITVTCLKEIQQM